MKKLMYSCLFMLFGMFIFTSHVGAQAGETTILFKPEVSLEEKQEFLAQNQFDLLYEIPEVNLVTVNMDEAQIAELERHPFIEALNPATSIKKPEITTIQPVTFRPVQRLQTLMSPISLLWDFQWDMKAVTSDGQSYSLHTPSTGTVIGIIDSGIDTSHPDLQHSIVEGSKNLVPAGGHNGTEPEEQGKLDDIEDKLGHGTGVAGQITANGMLKGAAPGIGIKVYRVFGTKSAKTSWVIKAIIEAANDEVDVINLSIGEYMLVSGQFSNGANDSAEYNAYKRAINYAYEKGSVVVASVGNDGVQISDNQQMIDVLNSKLNNITVVEGKVLDMPGHHQNVVAVGSTGPTKELSLFSNYDQDFLNVLAPGGDFRYLYQYGQDQWTEEKWFEKELLLTTWLEGGYNYDAGTSFAAPKVSAAVALIIDKYGWKDNPEKVMGHLKNYSTYEPDLTDNYRHLNIVNLLTH
ncbi:S8 family serine peptidase [Paenibacillus thiaminolyticus]|uniref:Leader peptide-processing serine protease n=1 Tax=Paenibacillus thiaminolyticus TaxID=49283 RepID=A0AAP9DV45_PANTH|nr:S8 family serine peptidase [Paenibacillus thiaminolyticus]MCY9536801.1 S8 family serine peptidase [Paenibacillus thiaminolyticus]MCY9603983.1 S8 family serine peptidase [Paenibacillus thiaminolyticus]MCY9609191.1 S8 family serine peptidase [Paenibacillus thiaminolyticus]MCY9612277.1 S8 family serine peptidase [Paenibacillus thiaminolyticus]MCY9621735.1 S8 family serine peptidase [Paenibacillus thiaminolyticus]